MLAEADTNPRAIIGANGPPDPFDAHKTNIDDLYIEAGNWCDGAQIENEAQAAEVDRLIDEFKTAIAAAEKSRDKEIEPLSQKVTAVREKYYPLLADMKTRPLGTAIRAKNALLAVKSAWGRKVEAERAAELKRQQDAAAKAAAEAAEAAKAAVGGLQASEQAEALVHDAKVAARGVAVAAKAVKERGMRDNWVVKGFAEAVEGEEGQIMKGSAACLRHYLRTRPEAILEALLEVARVDVRNGIRTIPGVIVDNDRRAV